MNDIIIYNVKKTIFIILVTSLLLYTAMFYNDGLLPTLFEYSKWLKNFSIGDYGLNANGTKEIVLFNFEDNANLIDIGPSFLHTVGLTSLAILISFSFSLLLNLLTVIRKNTFTNIICEIFNWFSTIHIMIMGIVLFAIFDYDVGYGLGLIIICFGSTAFSQLSSLQYEELKELNGKDFIIAARAWGDSVFKHLKRGFTLNSINQILSLWIVYFSNTMIYEIFFQKPGIGYIFYRYFLDDTVSVHQISSSKNNIIQEPSIFLAISMILIISIVIINAIKTIITHYLIEVRR